MCRQFLISVLALGFLYSAKCEIVNAKVIRTIDIQSQLVKIDAVISIQNWGLKYINNFIYALDPDIHNFYIKFRNKQGEELLFEKADIKCDGNETWCNHFNVLLDKHLPPNKTYNIKVELVYIDKIVPMYKTRTFKQDHIVSYSGNLLFYSPYKTLLLKTAYAWNKIANLQMTHRPHHEDRNSINYSHTSVAPFSFEKISMEFMNNEPALVVTDLERIIDVSHFGKIYVEDRVAIKNEGSKLVGPYEYNLGDMETKASKWFYTHLPASAENVQFFDTIGNSSKSTLLHFKKYKTFKFRPRYPLLGGWKTFYIIKYSVPIFEYLYHDFHGKFVLKMRAVDHILDGVVVRKSSVKILLPEAAHIVQVDVPYGFKRSENENHYTSLCTFGRPTVVLNGSNVVENHIADFKVEYLFPLRYLFRVPLLLILYLETVFICFILVSHIKSN